MQNVSVIHPKDQAESSTIGWAAQRKRILMRYKRRKSYVMTSWLVNLAWPETFSAKTCHMDHSADVPVLVTMKEMVCQLAIYSC